MAKRRKRGRWADRELETDRRGRAYPLALRLKVVEEALRGETSLRQLSRVFGPCVTTIENWLALYDEGGVDALTPEPPQPAP